MLFKEMGEAKKREKVHEIDLWDEAHKKKDAHMKAVLDMAYHELAKRKTDSSGVLSSQDYDDVFRNVVGKKTKLRGYYDHKNWSHVKVSQEQAMLKLKIKAMDDKLEDMSDDMNLMCTFIEQKYPGEDWRNIVATGKKIRKWIFLNKLVMIFHMSLKTFLTNQMKMSILHQIICSYTKAKDGRGKPSLPHEHMITKQSSIRRSAKVSESSQRYIESTRAHDNGNKKVDIFEQVDNDSTNGFDDNPENLYASVNATSNYVQQLCSIKCTNAKDRLANPSVPYERTNAKQLSLERLAQRTKTSQRNVESSMVTHERVTNEGYIFGQDSNHITNGSVNNFEDSCTNRNTIPNNVQRLHSVNSTRPKESYSSQDLPYQNMTAKQSIIQSSIKRPRTSQIVWSQFYHMIKPNRALRERKYSSILHLNQIKGWFTCFH